MKIKKILSIRDTRSMAEVDSRMVAIAGSGEKSQCALCGHLHEIHATVLLDTGSSVVVGIGCAKKSAPVAFKTYDLALKIVEQLDKKAALLEENEDLCARGNWERWNGSPGQFSKLIKYTNFEKFALRVAPNKAKIATCVKKIEALSEQLAAIEAGI